MHSLPRRSVPALLVLPFLLAGCDLTDPDACTAEIRYGISVEVFNIANGAPIMDGLGGTLRDGDYVEDMEVMENIVQGAPERAGTYDLTITAEGFQTLQESGIEVRENECHVTTRVLTAELTPVPLG